jgi:hypothetical protein
MKSKLKIYLGGVGVTLFIVASNYIFSSNLPVLVISLLLVVLLFNIVHQFKSFVKFAKFWFRFAIVLVSIFVLLGIIQNGFDVLHLKETLRNGILTALILLNTVFVVELFILSITINDILSINIPIKYLKFFILMRTLMVRGMAKFDNEKVLFNIIPEFQHNKKINFRNIKSAFMQNLVLIMTIAFYVIEQGKILGPLIDNRIRHIYER